MTNRIRKCHWYPSILDPTLGEVAIAVYPERLASRTQVRGHLTGPRCPYATTIEVGYPWRETSRTYEKEGEPHISARAVIPEPSLWEPQTPFLYEGTVELWDNGQLSDRMTIRLGLRDLRLGGRGFLLNGRPFAVHGVARERFTLEELPELRRAGFDTLLSSLRPDQADLWDAADRLGFFVVGLLSNVESLRSGELPGRHPSSLALVIAEEPEAGEEFLDLPFGCFCIAEPYQPFIGFELAESSYVRLAKCDFLFCDQSLLADLSFNPLPKLVRLYRTSLNDTESQELLATPGVCGWVLDPFL
jgi:hypothetical protein